MSRRVHITFGGAAYDERTRNLVTWTNTGPEGEGPDEVWVYDDRWLMNQSFFGVNHWLWKTPRRMGFGWCSWKPFILMNALSKLDDGDIVLYTDADTVPINDYSCLFDICDRSADGLVLFEAQGCNNALFTRHDCIRAMGLDGRDFERAQHACGRFALVRKGGWFISQFLSEWLAYSINPICQGHHGSSYSSDQPEFIRHSAEQSVLTLLALKYKIPLHREACQNGWPASPGCGQPEDTYPQLFEQIGRTGDLADLSGSKYFYVPGESR